MKTHYMWSDPGLKLYRCNGGKCYDLYSYAKSFKKAMSNMKYQYKKIKGLPADANIYFDVMTVEVVPKGSYIYDPRKDKWVLMDMFSGEFYTTKNGNILFCNSITIAIDLAGLANFINRNSIFNGEPNKFYVPFKTTEPCIFSEKYL